MWVVKWHQLSQAARPFSTRAPKPQAGLRRETPFAEPKPVEKEPQLTFRRYRLLPELLNVLENQMHI